VGYVVNEDGEVVAKKYRVAGEEVSLVLLWGKRRERTEWEVFIPGGDLDHGALLKALHDSCQRLDFIDSRHSPEALLWWAGSEANLTEDKARARRTTDVRLFPTFERTLWRVERTGDQTFRMRLENRKGVSLVVWTVGGWFNWLATGEFH
jgi:hypothetical protein